MHEAAIPSGPVAVRWSSPEDAAGLAAVHAAAWRHAYAGIIPGVTLARMIARRGPRWWERMSERGFHALVLAIGEDVAGYATLGPSRGAGAGAGEIYELYLRPECQGCGLGRRLFGECRRALADRGRPRLVVWALAENELACRFYRGMGGTEAAREVDRFCGVPLAKVGFIWR